MEILAIILVLFSIISILIGCGVAYVVGATGYMFWLITGLVYLLIWGVGGLYLYY